MRRNLILIVVLAVVLTACTDDASSSTTTSSLGTTTTAGTPVPTDATDGRVNMIVEVPAGTNSIAMDAAAEVLEERLEDAVPGSAAAARVAGQRIQVALIGPGVVDVPASVLEAALDEGTGSIPFELSLVSISRIAG
jgi:hypothetical protein